MLGIRYPIIMAPMFLVSNETMIIEAVKAGITGCIPALNWRTDETMRAGLKKIREGCDGPFGVNLIVNKSNVYFKRQLQTCLDMKVDYIITSLGSPKATIEACRKHGIKVFCDVTNLEYAKKVEAAGADAIIAVNKEAGGHSGQIPAKELLPQLIKNTSIPVISAGGVGDGEGLWRRINEDGAVGVSVGTIFIASEESPVSDAYKQACIDYGAKDIRMTTKVSGTPMTVIYTPYVQKIGLEQNALEKFLSKNRFLKKYFKMLTAVKGAKKVREAAFKATYKTVWCAGPTIEYVHKVRPVREIVADLVEGYDRLQSP